MKLVERVISLKETTKLFQRAERLEIHGNIPFYTRSISTAFACPFSSKSIAFPTSDKLNINNLEYDCIS
jgi:hypothetical protein